MFTLPAKYSGCFNLDNSGNFAVKSEIPMIFECYLYRKRHNLEKAELQTLQKKIQHRYELSVIHIRNGYNIEFDKFPHSLTLLTS